MLSEQADFFAWCNRFWVDHDRYPLPKEVWDWLKSHLQREFPRIVCLCGSTRFRDEFQLANYQESIKGNIVLSVGFYMHRPETLHTQELGCTPEQKIQQDDLHKRKIDLADEVFVLNVGGYIGESTRSEIDHAIATGTPVRYLEAQDAER